MGNIGSERAAQLAAQLQRKIPIDQPRHYDLVIENDLAGRAVLAVLWRYRSQLTVHLVTEEPTSAHVGALKTGLETVRNPPAVRLTDAPRASQLVATSHDLIWALLTDRSSAAIRATLAERAPERTSTPFSSGFAALDGGHPDQTQPCHELVLRDVIRAHARFLNFYGDRFHAQDLYERSKYPQWFTPPTGFTAALPQLWCQTITPEGEVLQHREFTGTVLLEPDPNAPGARVQVNFGRIVEELGKPVDVTLSLTTPEPWQANALHLQVHRNQKLVHTFETSAAEVQRDIDLSRVKPGTDVLLTLRVEPQSVAVQQACSVEVHFSVHPQGTHGHATVFSRVKSWLAVPFRGAKE